MAFTQVNLNPAARLWGLVAATDRTPQFYVYQGYLAADAIATIATAGYFNGYTGAAEGDLILAAGTDGAKLFKVTAVSAAGVVTFADIALT